MNAKGTGPRIIVGSGWWSTDEPSSKVNPRRKEVGDAFIRSTEFFDIWLESVLRAGTPDKIIVVDSASPNLPAEDRRAAVEWVRLPFNAKHATDHLGQWCGWTRSVLVSANYALAAECEYFIYVEQDCLIRGENLLEELARGTRTGLAFGSGDGTPQPIQQSLFVLRHDRISAFLHNLSRIKARDADLSPEWKFVCACWTPLVWAANAGFLKIRRVRKLIRRLAFGRFYDHIALGTGRARPVPFDAPAYYFQHGSRDEVDEHVARLSSKTKPPASP